MRISREWIAHAFFTLVEHGAIRVLDALTTLVLIRILGGLHFGMFSVYQSWVGLVLLVLPYAELSLYRDYGTLKATGELGSQLATFKTYNFIKLALAAAIAMSLALPEKGDIYSARISLLGFAMALPLSQSFYGFMRDPLRFERQQHLVAMVSSVQKICLIGAMIAAFYSYPGNVPVLFGGAMAVYVVFAFVWAKAARNVVPRARQSLREFAGRLKKIMRGTVLWIHVNGVITGTVLTLDILMLNAVKADLEEIGRYSIALKAAGFFQLIPMALANSFGVYLGKWQHSQNPRKEQKAMYALVAVFSAMCFALFKVAYHFGMPILDFIGKHKITGDAFTRVMQYYYWQMFGLMLMSAAFPLSTYLGARAPLKKITVQIFIPWFLFAALTYRIAAGHGLLYAARANVVTYGALCVGMVVFYLVNRRTFEKGKGA